MDHRSPLREALEEVEGHLAVARVRRASKRRGRGAPAENIESSDSNKNVLLPWRAHFSVLDGNSAKVSISYEEMEKRHPVCDKVHGDTTPLSSPSSPKQRRQPVTASVRGNQGHRSSDRTTTPNICRDRGPGSFLGGVNTDNRTTGFHPQNSPTKQHQQRQQQQQFSVPRSPRAQPAISGRDREKKHLMDGMPRESKRKSPSRIEDSPRRARKVSVEATRGKGLEVRVTTEDESASSSNYVLCEQRNQLRGAAGGRGGGEEREEGEEGGEGGVRSAWGGGRSVRDKKPSCIDHRHIEYHTGRALELGELGEQDSDTEKLDSDTENHSYNNTYYSDRGQSRKRSPYRSKAEEEEEEEEEDEENRRRWRSRGRNMWSANNTDLTSRARSASYKKTLAFDQTTYSTATAPAARCRSPGAQPYHGLYARSLQANGIDPDVFRMPRRCLHHCCDRRGVAGADNTTKTTARVGTKNKKNGSSSLFRRCNRRGCDYLATEWARAPTNGLPDRLEAGRVLDSFNRRAELLGTEPPTSLRAKPAWMENPGDPEYMYVHAAVSLIFYGRPYSGGGEGRGGGEP